MITLAVRIRLSRVGRKHETIFRMVAADSKAPRDGRFIEILGHYDPRKDPPLIELKEDRILYWHRMGAKPTASSYSLIKKAGIILS